MVRSARQSSNIRPRCRVCTVAAGKVGCRVDSVRRTNQKRSTAQVLRGGSKDILPSYNRASGVHARDAAIVRAICAYVARGNQKIACSSLRRTPAVS